VPKTDRFSTVFPKVIIMKTTIQRFTALAIVLAALCFATAANAVCYTGFLKIMQIGYTTSAQTSPNAYIYAVPERSVIGSAYYVLRSSDPVAINLVDRAMQNNRSLYFVGDAASCPASSTTSGSIYAGTILYVQDY
jgi:hypothetical protein